MKALTLRHPWAFAVAYLGKRVENRDWDERYQELCGLNCVTCQPIAIHGGTAPKRGNNKGWREFQAGFDAMAEMTEGQLTPEALARFEGRKSLELEDFIVPGIVAVATIVHATRGSNDRWAIPGQLHLLLNPVFTLPEAVPCTGSQGFWELDEETEYQVTQQVQRIPIPKTGVTLQDWYA